MNYEGGKRACPHSIAADEKRRSGGVIASNPVWSAAFAPWARMDAGWTT